MIGEFAIYGVLLPRILVYGLAALLLQTVLRRLLELTAFYRLVWHPALFNLALFVIVLAGIVAVSPAFTSP